MCACGCVWEGVPVDLVKHKLSIHVCFLFFFFVCVHFSVCECSLICIFKRNKPSM